MRIIPAFDPREDGRACFLSSVEVISIQHLAFQSREKAFGHRVVEAVSNAPHRGPHAKLLAASAKSDRGVLAAVIGVENHTVGPALCIRPLQCDQYELALQAIAHSPPDN